MIDLKKNRMVTVVFLILLAVLLTPLFSTDTIPHNQALEACKEITSDRDRLFCFDELFETPLLSSPQTSSIPIQTNYPQKWLEIQTMEKQRASGSEGFWSTEKNLKLYDTLHLTQTVDGLGIIVLSCVNNISQVEIMLEKPLQGGAIPITIIGKNREEHQWLLDNTGYILREGYGLPAIATIRNLMGESQFSLAVNDRLYTLSLKGFDQQIKALQTLCHWR